MEDRTIHPSMKAVRAAYVLAAVVFAAVVWAYYEYARGANGYDAPRWLPALALFVFLAPLRMHWQRSLITLRLHDDHLTLETGFLSRARRTVDMAKIQDVTVRQTFGQRLMGVGDLIMETAGESGRISIVNVDRPREIADAIIIGSKRSSATRGGSLTGSSGA
jgi:membrane protein YdbS with pleckstrin-like domain